MIFIIKGFGTIVFICIISTTFRLICTPVFFRCLSNSGTYTKLQTTSFIEPTGDACSDSIPCKGETGHPQKVRLEEHWKAVVRGEIEKLGMADHIWKEKGNYLS